MQSTNFKYGLPYLATCHVTFFFTFICSEESDHLFMSSLHDTIYNAFRRKEKNSEADRLPTQTVIVFIHLIFPCKRGRCHFRTIMCQISGKALPLIVVVL